MADRDPPADGESRPGARGGITRRDLFRTAGIAAAGGAILGPSELLAQEAARAGQAVGPGPVPLKLVVNGRKREVAVEPRRTLLDALRADLKLTGAKPVCDRGTCGACTIWLDGAPVYACTVLAVEAEGHEVTTIEGLGTPDAMHPVQAAFVEKDALQCGFCTPGFVMACAAAVDQHGAGLTREKLVESVSGNICRCGTYPHVIDACLSAARGRKGK